MAQKMFHLQHVDFSTDQLLSSTFQEMKDILNTQLHLHETMMRTSELYKTTYTEMFQRMKTLEQKFPSLSPALMSLMLDYSKISATTQDSNSSNRKRQSPNKRVAKAKKPRKVKEQKSGQKQKSQKKKSTPPIQPKNLGEDTEAVSTPSLTTRPITPTTEPTIDDWWLDYTHLMEDIEQQEKQTTDITAVDSSSGIMEDLYQEEKLTPLQKSCSVCRHNNKLRYISCNSGQIQCHVCCMDLMNCMCYYDEGGMMKDMVSQDFEGHILSV
ncbi:uncharacterized protein LOC124279012 [Haliotis rubra]|uniref:uncharacterized protein LOC124278539 n=1 Tax=Haliotis rubra TaxID=36100 RepID=UPI001EE5CAA2|nr:uncharacterized protein LOC124278539 [Haliotis rubra]XP_046570762.1 uncharacterized protein LOC124279012 [Haliotis rubra]